MPSPSSYRKNAHNSKKNTDSTPSPVKETPAPVTPNTKRHDEDTIKSLAARTEMLEKRVLELEGVLQGIPTASSSKKLTIFSNTNAALALLPAALPR